MNSRSTSTSPSDATLAARQERIAGRLLEDERLRGDLADDEYQPLLDWALLAAEWLVASTARLDDEQAENQLDGGLGAIREAVLAAGDAVSAYAEGDADRMRAALVDAGRAAKAGPLKTLLRRLTNRPDLAGPEVAGLVARALGPVKIKELGAPPRKSR